MAFLLGALLAGFGGVLGGTMISLAPGEDTAFLLNSLIVVIIGGMGSLGGAAIGALALGLVDAYADVYLSSATPTSRTTRSCSRSRCSSACSRSGRSGSSGGRHEPVAAAARAVARARRSSWSSPRSRRSCSRDFFVSVILTKALWLGIAAASLIFLSAYGGMVSLAQVGLYGIAGMTLANLVAADGGLDAAWSPWLAVARRARRRDARSASASARSPRAARGSTS